MLALELRLSCTNPSIYDERDTASQMLVLCFHCVTYADMLWLNIFSIVFPWIVYSFIYNSMCLLWHKHLCSPSSVETFFGCALFKCWISCYFWSDKITNDLPHFKLTFTTKDNLQDVSSFASGLKCHRLNICNICCGPVLETLFRTTGCLEVKI